MKFSLLNIIFFLFLVTNVLAQPGGGGPGGGGPPEVIPIAGIEYLLAAGAFLGWRFIRKKRTP